MANAGILLPGVARHTFEGINVMLVMECGAPERITESLFSTSRGRIMLLGFLVQPGMMEAMRWWPFSMMPTSWGCDPTVHQASIEDARPLMQKYARNYCPWLWSDER